MNCRIIIGEMPFRSLSGTNMAINNQSDKFQFVEQLKSSRLRDGGGCSVSCTGYSPVMRSAKSTIPRMKKSKDVNVVYEGSPSRMRSVRLISLGMTILPRSSTRLTIPVAFIYNLSS